ncbi:hypothetical protein Sjap_013221 [Stephania japonica]|uniref:Uncharacterized protein n=1 Tax=Stephania japonica TaxID=461633 RepID=A0AAP0IXH8_9MAGN
MPAPPTTTSPTASDEGKAGSQVAGASQAPQRRGTDPPPEDRIPITLIAKDTMSKVFKWGMIPEGYCWKSGPDYHKDQYLCKWKTRALERTLTLNDLYLHLHMKNHDGVTFIDTISAQLKRRRQELTQATPDHPVDEMALYYDMVGDCPKGRVYSIGSLGNRKRSYDELGASTSQKAMVPRSKFDNIADQLRQEQQQQVQMDPVDPLQHDNIDRERKDWVVETDWRYLGDKQLGET